MTTLWAASFFSRSTICIHYHSGRVTLRKLRSSIPARVGGKAVKEHCSYSLIKRKRFHYGCQKSILQESCGKSKNRGQTKARIRSTKKYTKTEILNEIAQNTELSKKQVSAVLDELGNVIERHIRKRAVGEFTLPGLLKIKSVVRPARPARKNVPNPFKPGETMDIPRKPATTRVKVLPLKKLKEFAQ